MLAYFIPGRGFHGTIGEAKAAVKFAPPRILIQEIDIATDKAAVLSLLNGELPEYKLLRVWERTPGAASPCAMTATAISCLQTSKP